MAACAGGDQGIEIFLSIGGYCGQKFRLGKNQSIVGFGVEGLLRKCEKFRRVWVGSKVCDTKVSNWAKV